jgi:hypothetical protein
VHTTGVHGADQHEAGRVGDGREGLGDGHPAVLQGLAEHFQDVFLKFMMGFFNINLDALVKSPNASTY